MNMSSYKRFEWWPPDSTGTDLSGYWRQRLTKRYTQRLYFMKKRCSKYYSININNIFIYVATYN